MSIVLGEAFSFDQTLPTAVHDGTIGSEERARVAIVGAGLAGLTCAFRLAESRDQGVMRDNVVVLERESHVGGRIRSLQIGASVLNLGALTFQPEHYPRYVALLTELGLSGKVRRIPRRRMIFASDGRSARADNASLAWDGVRGLIGRGLFTTREAAQLLRFYFFHGRVTSPKGISELMHLHELSMAEWARRFGFGQSLQEKVVEPFARLCFCGAEDISAAFGVFLLGSNLSYPANLDGGFCQVADALAERLRGVIETEALALNVVREPGGFAVLYSQRGQLRRMHSQFLVVSTPAYMAAHLIPEMREWAAGVQYGSGRGTVLSGRLKTSANLHIRRTSSSRGTVIFGGESQSGPTGTHYFNVLTYRGDNAVDAARQLFVDGQVNQLADYRIAPAVAAPRPGQKPPPIDWGDGLYVAGDCVGLFPSQETAVSSGERVANLIKKYG